MIVEVRPGEGGDDAVAFAKELFASLTAHAARAGEVEVTGTGPRIWTARVPADAGLDRFAGTHRVQRIPANGGGRRHTSTATVAVLDDPDGTPAAVLDEGDVTVETFRASGPGGQHRNKTDSAVRAVHEPTGIVVTAAGDRSQHRNRAAALAELERRLAGDAEEQGRERRNGERRRQVVTGERPVKQFTHNAQRGEVVCHDTGRRWRLQDFQKGRLR